MRAETSPDVRTLAAFGGAVLIGGANFVAVKFSNEDLAPSYGAGLRFAAAALLLFLLVRLLRLPFPSGRGWFGTLMFGIIGFGVAYASLYYAVAGLGAGTTAVIMASTPLATLAFAVLHGQERFTARGLVGGVLAIAGIGILSAGSIEGEVRLLHLLAALVGVLGAAESTVIIKAYPGAHPLSTNAVAMAAGAIFLLLASSFQAEEWILPSDVRTWLVLLWLVVAGSVGLFTLFLYVVQRWTASATVYAITMMPVVAVALGALVADEPITWQLASGGGLVLAAVYVGALSTHRQEAVPDVEDAADAGAVSA